MLAEALDCDAFPSLIDVPQVATRDFVIASGEQIGRTPRPTSCARSTSPTDRWGRRSRRCRSGSRRPATWPPSGCWTRFHEYSTVSGDHRHARLEVAADEHAVGGPRRFSGLFASGSRQVSSAHGRRAASPAHDVVAAAHSCSASAPRSAPASSSLLGQAVSGRWVPEPVVLVPCWRRSRRCFLGPVVRRAGLAQSQVSGSSGFDAYATLGELVAWVCGWCLMLEYAVSGSRWWRSPGAQSTSTPSSGP